MIPLYSDRPLNCVPFMTLMLIAANIAWFWLQVTGVGSLRHSVILWGFIPAEAFGGISQDIPGRPAVPLTLLTSIFSHGGITHIAGNMLYLWVFGRNVEDNLGHVRFLLLYLLAGVGSSLAFGAAFPDSTVPLVGASGAISGVLGVYFLRFPSSRIMTLFIFIIIVRIIPVNAFLFLVIWFFLQVAGSAGSIEAARQGTAGVAWVAHVAGFVIGMAWALLSLRRRHR